MIIVVAHNKGGVGKTTSAFNLMFELNTDVVFDEDIHRGISVLAMMREEPLPFHIESGSTPKELIEKLRKVSNSNQTALVDCGGFDSDVTRAALSVADFIIVPAADTPTERLGLVTFENTLAEISKQMKRKITAHLLICKTHHAKKHFPKLDLVLERTKHIKRLNSVLSFRPDHYESHEYGLGVTERLATRHTAAGKEVVALAKEIKQLITD